MTTEDYPRRLKPRPTKRPRSTSARLSVGLTSCRCCGPRLCSLRRVVDLDVVLDAAAELAAEALADSRLVDALPVVLLVQAVDWPEARAARAGQRAVQFWAAADCAFRDSLWGLSR